jgi:hypothetical protein
VFPSRLQPGDRWLAHATVRKCDRGMPAHRAVIVLTSPEVDADLTEVRRRFDPQFNSVPSHLTLVFRH